MSELIAECSMRTTAQRLLIVNADDYGYSQQVNAAIEKSFELELISSATLMANMPGFMHAVMWLKRQPIQPAIGVHLNLDEGLPLTSMFRELPGGRNLFYNGNALTSSSRYLRAAEC